MTPAALRRLAKSAMMASIIACVFAVVSLSANLGIDGPVFGLAGGLFLAGLLLDRTASRRDGGNFR